NLRGREARQLTAQLLDIGALLADQDARTGRVHGHAALLVRALDDDLGDAGCTLHLHDMSADGAVLMKELAVLTPASEPASVPGAVDADAQADVIDVVTHYSASFSAAAALV